MRDRVEEWITIPYGTPSSVEYIERERVMKEENETEDEGVKQSFHEK